LGWEEGIEPHIKDPPSPAPFSPLVATRGSESLHHAESPGLLQGPACQWHANHLQARRGNSGMQACKRAPRFRRPGKRWFGFMSALGSCVWLCGTLAECDTEKMPSQRRAWRRAAESPDSSKKSRPRRRLMEQQERKRTERTREECSRASIRRWALA
jgi:hypothetical protein